MRFLVVEPSRFQQILLKAIFNDKGIQPDMVSSCEEALEVLKYDDFDYVFTAYSLPDGSGLDLTRAICSREQPPSVLLLTSENKRSILHEAISAGVTRIIHRASGPELELVLSEISNEWVNVNAEPSRILYIEDDRATALATAELLKTLGAECTLCKTGEEALEFAVNQDFDLIISDYFLQGEVTGLDIVHRIRHLGNHRARVPILICSVQDDERRKIEILKNGANDYLSKPMIHEELLVRANNLLIQKKLLDKVEAQQKRLRELAMTDQLTSLYNRHFLVQYAPKRLAEARRHKNDLSLLVLDLDYFKKINDQYGHEAGDLVLRETAQILKSTCREEDTAIRMGGEEFLLLLPHCSFDGLEKKTEYIRKEIESANPNGIHVTASVGAVCVEKGANASFSELFELADSAVYQAKSEGRNRVIVHRFNTPSD